MTGIESLDVIADTMDGIPWLDKLSTELMSASIQIKREQAELSEKAKLSESYKDALNDVCKALGLTDGTGLPEMGEIICAEIERLERLTHQLPVLDAEGNRIEPAMDVWWVCEGDERGIHAEKLHVESIGEDGLVTCDPFNGGTWVELEPSELYVNRPLLDADGVPIHEGDTVWLTDGRGPWKVSRIVCADRWRVICDDEENGHLNVYPDHLTHTKLEQPDSWEQIYSDCELTGEEYVYDRMDERPDDMTPDMAKSYDLVRRAKALAERDSNGGDR